MAKNDYENEANETEQQFYFNGFEEANTVAVPQIVFDQLLPQLGEAELKALLYIIRRTRGFHKDEDQISFNQFMRGITTKEGRILDMGCGVKNRTTLSKALKSLQSKGIIKSRKGQDEKGENETSLYSIRWRDETGEVVRKTYYPGTFCVLPGSTQNVPTNREYIQNRESQRDLSKGPGGKGVSHSQEPLTTRNEADNTRQPENRSQSKAQTTTKLTQPPLTQDEIDQNRKRGRNTSGINSLGDLLGIPQNHLIELDHQFSPNSPGQFNKPAASHNQGNWKSAPYFIQKTIGEYFSPEMHDQAIHSTITRVHRIYEQWTDSCPELNPRQKEATFYTKLQEARTKSKYANITTLTPQGLPNRVPYFLRCLQRSLLNI